MWKLLALTVGVAGSVAAQSERLGTITFPTSGSPAAQQHFIRGTLYLHSFEYEAAAKEYQEAQRLQPEFAMAYWGEAMTYNHPVWDQQDKPAALAALKRLAPTPAAREALAPTGRERAWLHAVEVLYAEGSKQQRDTLYSAEMERIAHAAPDDDEAQTFYALSLLGLSGTRRVIPTYQRAGQIAQAVMKRNPDHPGATHYVIHAYDDPIHARQGLPAAQAYSGIAPGAAHAQHMTTHIFLALGMWNEVIAQNVIASGPDSTTWKPGHYTLWLEYGLLQEGRFTEARNLLDLMARNTAANEPLSRRATLVQMRDYYVMNTERWDFTAPVPNLDGAGPIFRAVHAFATGFAAFRQNQIAEARSQADILRRLAEESGGSGIVGVLAYQLSGLVHLNAGDTARGFDLIRQAAAIEDTLPMEFGPPLIAKPTHELLGELYFTLGRSAEAQREFEKALVLAPRRLRSLLGLWVAARQAHQFPVARSALTEVDQSLRSSSTADRQEILLGPPRPPSFHATGWNGLTWPEEAVANSPLNPELYGLLGGFYEREHRYGCALDALESMFALDSTRADSAFYVRMSSLAARVNPASHDGARMATLGRVCELGLRTDQATIPQIGPSRQDSH